MRGRPIRVAELSGSPAERGGAHGDIFGAEIRDYAAERARLAVDGTWGGRRITIDDALELAEQCLPAHQRYAPDLYEEMTAMAAAAEISPAQAVIVGGFTDFVDIVRSRAGSAPFEDACTAVIVPDAAADGPGFLAQTWDMHDTAMPHVVLLHLQDGDAPEALVFSTVGCVGQIGLNEAGIAVGINNLASHGTLGVTWPFVVRRALAQTDLDAAVSAILDSDLAGAHNYLVLGADGRGVSIEAFPEGAHVTETSGAPLVHTNHCLDPVMAEAEAERSHESLRSSHQRLETARSWLEARPVDVALLEKLLKEPETICAGVRSHRVATCGAAIMRPGTGELWALWGNPVDNEFERFEV